jgi:hypothetical protein
MINGTDIVTFFNSGYIFDWPYQVLPSVGHVFSQPGYLLDRLIALELKNISLNDVFDDEEKELPLSQMANFDDCNNLYEAMISPNFAHFKLILIIWEKSKGSYMPTLVLEPPSYELKHSTY